MDLSWEEKKSRERELAAKKREMNIDMLEGEITHKRSR